MLMVFVEGFVEMRRLVGVKRASVSKFALDLPLS